MKYSTGVLCAGSRFHVCLSTSALNCGIIVKDCEELCFSSSKFFLQHCPSTLFWQQSPIYSGIFIQISHYAVLPPEYASSGYAAGNAGIVSPTWPSWHHGKILLQRIKYGLYKFRTGRNICRCQTCSCWTCFSAAETACLVFEVHRLLKTAD